MKKIIDIDYLYQCAKNETSEDLENFDKIFYEITENDYTFRLEDIILLCELQIQNFPYMEPHQESKIMDMVFSVINEYGTNEAFPRFIQGLEKIIGVKEFLVGMYLRMLLNSYSEEDILKFTNCLNKCSNDFKNKIKKIINESIKMDSKRYELKGNIIIKHIQS